MDFSNNIYHKCHIISLCLVILHQSYHKAVQLNKNMGEAHLNLGVFYHLRDNLTSAGYHYSEAGRLMPDNPLVKENLKKLCKTDLRVPHCHNT